MVARGVAITEVDRTMTNGVRLGGHVMVPNLGYKKDAFLEPSLISNSLAVVVQWFGCLVK